MASFIVNTAPSLPFNLAMSAVDGMTRGVTITAMPALIAAAGSSASGWWTAALLGAIATNGGGWIAQILGMHKAQWTPGRPAILDGGILGTLDVWGAIIVSVVYAALTRTYPALEPVGDFLSARVPDTLRDAGFAAKATTGQVVTKDTARAIAVLVLGSLFALRALVTQICAWTASRPDRAAAAAKAKKEVGVKTKPVPAAAAPDVVKSPTEVSESPKPKKRRARKSKSPTP